VSTKVGIHRADASGYSEAWKTEENFPEKDSLRELGRLLGHDDGNLFRSVVRAGETVVVKPNWVLDRHPGELDIFGVVTHSAVLRGVVDLLYEALGGEGSIVIADAPQWNCDFENLLRVTEVERIRDYYRARHGFDVPVLDLRQIAAGVSVPWVKQSERLALAGDPLGYAVVDFGPESAFIGIPNIERIYGADYDRSETRRHHNDDKHEYLVSKTMLTADLVVHVPKLKVHKKVGVTLNAKGMVGINGHKNWLAHYRVGSPSEGGDQFPDGRPLSAQAKSRLMRMVRDYLLASQSRPREVLFDILYGSYRLVRPLLRRQRSSGREVEVEGGNWYGNDTAWRMTVDLARAIIYADEEGRICDKPQRRFFSIVDGIVGGEKEGPLAPTPKPCGVLLAGENLLAVDLVGTRLMGFDWRKLRKLRWLVGESPQDFGVGNPTLIEITSNVPEWLELMRDEHTSDLAFAPHPAWRGHIELNAERRPEAATD
jgi:uncharacterized protein (DUF362 family)